MARDLANCVVVITGASSGIGRAAARRFALESSSLVLAARAEGPLRDAAEECERLGAAVLAVPTDVRDESAVLELASRAVEGFGRLDVWVNSAGVMAYGRFGEVPSEVFRAVIETNLFGQVHGARAAVASSGGRYSRPFEVLLAACAAAAYERPEDLRRRHAYKRPTAAARPITTLIPQASPGSSRRRAEAAAEPATPGSERRGPGPALT